MKPTEVKRFKKLYQRHLRLLKLQGKVRKPLRPTLGLYVESVNILIACPDQLTPEQLEFICQTG